MILPSSVRSVVRTANSCVAPLLAYKLITGCAITNPEVIVVFVIVTALTLLSMNVELWHVNNETAVPVIAAMFPPTVADNGIFDWIKLLLYNAALTTRMLLMYPVNGLLELYPVPIYGLPIT